MTDPDRKRRSGDCAPSPSPLEDRAGMSDGL